MRPLNPRGGGVSVEAPPLATLSEACAMTGCRVHAWVLNVIFLKNEIGGLVR